MSFKLAHIKKQSIPALRHPQSVPSFWFNCRILLKEAFLLCRKNFKLSLEPCHLVDLIFLSSSFEYLPLSFSVFLVYLHLPLILALNCLRYVLFIFPAFLSFIFIIDCFCLPLLLFVLLPLSLFIHVQNFLLSTIM